MLRRLSIKRREETLTFKLFDQARIREVLRAFPLESRLGAEFFNAERDVFQLRKRPLRDRAVHVGAVHELQQAPGL